MKCKISLYVFVLLLTLITACSNGTSQSNNKTTPSSDEQRDDSIESSITPFDSTESKYDTVDNEYWDSGNQFDPTLLENLDKLWSWHHTEYKSFGEYSSYQQTETAVASGNLDESISAELKLMLPTKLSITENSYGSTNLNNSGGIIYFDGSFANGGIQAGYICGYYELNSNESTLYNMLMQDLLFTDSLRPLKERETSEIEIGAYTYLEGVTRYICGDTTENYRIAYIIPLGIERITMLVFYVDMGITKQKISVYDEIAKSVEIV